MSNKPRTHLIGRDSETGRFESVEDARRHPSTSQVERLPNPGYGDTDPKKK